MLWLCVIVMVFVVFGGGWWSIVGLCWRQYVAMAVDQFVKSRKFCETGFLHTKFCATGSRRTKFCATAFLSHKKSDYTIWNFIWQVPITPNFVWLPFYHTKNLITQSEILCDRFPSHQILCDWKNLITLSKILYDRFPSHQILCNCLFVAQKNLITLSEILCDRFPSHQILCNWCCRKKNHITQNLSYFLEVIITAK